jgi:hypothetical protein
MEKITKYESEVLDGLIESSKANGHDFGIIEDLRGPFNMRQARGAISSLVKKNWITVHDAVTNESGTWTQFTFTAEARVALKIDAPAPAEQESPEVAKLRVKGNPLLTLINIVEALHPVQLSDPNLGHIDVPQLIEEARKHLDHIADALDSKRAESEVAR